MRGKNYNAGSRRLVGGSTLGIVLIILTVAIALVFVLLLYMPLTDQTNNAGVFGKGEETTWNKIVSISYEENEIGVGSKKDKIYLTVTYDNGVKEDVALSQMVCAGLDVTTSGTQNVSLSYGGFEQTIPITVKDVDCVLTYNASDGGRINGETRQTIVSGHDAGTVEAVPETGYTFVEWNDGYPYATRKDRNVNETREYKAIFEKTQFVVFFYYDDGTVAREDVVLYGEAATDIPKPSDPRMSVYGKTFRGWNVNEEDYKCVVRNMNVYPQYEKTATDVELTVSTDQYGSHMGETNVNEFGYYEHNSTASITATPYSSREFNCWEVYGYETATAANAEWIRVEKKRDTGADTKIIFIGDNREPCTFTSNSTGNAGTEYTLTFTPNEYMDLIKLNANFVYSNSTVTFINYQNAVKNNQEYIVADIPYGTTIGSALAGKFVAEGGTVQSTSGEKPTVTTDLGGTLTLKETDVATLTPASVYGLRFLGWYDKLDEKQALISDNKIFREPTSLIAKWEKLVYTVVFNFDTAENKTDSESIDVVYQSTIGSGGGVPTTQPYRDKYNFIGWEDQLTHDLVDDTTQITVKDEYVYDGDFLTEQKIYMIPRWEVKEHTITVVSSGSGQVTLRSISPMGTVEDAAVTGQHVIYETYEYQLILQANEGYYVSSCYWQYGNEVPQITSMESSESAPIPHSDVDNYFSITFSPKQYTATVYNGDAAYRGYIQVVGGSETGERYGLAYEESDTFRFHHGDTVLMNVLSTNEAFEISDIRVTGTVNGITYTSEIIESGLPGSHTLSYDLLLENCTSDLSIHVQYSGVSYTAGVTQPNNGTIGTTVFNGTASDYATAPAQRAYAPDESVFYVIDAAQGYYVSDFFLNGVRYDIYSAFSGPVVFYDWEVNGEYFGVGLKYIDNEYYYSYGTATYESVQYMYCRSVSDGEETIFIVYDALNERYEALDAEGAQNASVSPIFYEKLLDFLYAELKVEEKGLGNSSMRKDGRVTSVKLMLTLSADVNLQVFTTPITYKVTVKENKLANVTVSATEVTPGGKVSLTVSTLSGYTVEGYYLNGSEEMTEISTDRPGATYLKDFNDIQSDIDLVFSYRLISFSATFTANVGGLISVVDTDSDSEFFLSNSHTFEGLEYGSRVAFLIKAAENKRISSINVNGADTAVYYNMDKYLFVCDDVRASLDVKVRCDDALASSPDASGYALRLNTEGKNVLGSVQYGDNVVLTLLAEDGYNLAEVVISGNVSSSEKKISIVPKDDEVEFSDATGNANLSASSFTYLAGTEQKYTKAFVLTLPKVLYDAGSEAQVVIRTTKKSFAITCLPTENGTVSVPQSATYGSQVDINISAAADYYIDSIIVNGISLPFATSENWEMTEFISMLGVYSSGYYTITVNGETEVQVLFAKCAYTVRLDGVGAGGTTTVSLKDRDGNSISMQNGRAPHGSTVLISMAANNGYHIKSVYINGNDAGFEPFSATENTVKRATFTYKGEDGEGLAQNISIRVYYEINRYSFNYSIVNDSANFAGASGAGTLSVTGSFTAVGTTKYSGIPHGDNFSVIVTPAISSGYYLYSMSVTYKGENDAVATKKTRYCTDEDGIVPRSGGTIWFNRFWFADSSSLATGVTADIENITVTFKREVYSINLDQKTDGGVLLATFLNPSANAENYIVVYGKPVFTKEAGTGRWNAIADGALVSYYYDVGHNEFMTLSGNEYSSTGIRLDYKSGDHGEVVFTDGSKIYEMYFEYGLRCVISVTPDAGHDRTSFNVNGENRMDNIGNDRYTFTMIRSVSVDVSYLVQSFPIEIKSTIYTDRKNAQKVTASSGRSNEYVNIIMTIVDENGHTISPFSKSPEDLSIVKTLNYGTYVLFTLESKFNDKGVYLYNFTRAGYDVDGNPINKELRYVSGGSVSGGDTVYSGDVYGRVTYGPLMITERLTLNAFFEVSTYAVEVNISYDEALNNESRNTATKDDDATKTDWSVLWGNQTLVNVDIDTGYELDKITISTELGNIVLDSNNFGRDSDTYYYVAGEEDEINGVRNILHITSVKSNINVEIRLKRRSFTLLYRLNDTQTVYSLLTYYNENNGVYPRATRETDAAWQIPTRYYDELKAVIVPKDGYEIAAQKVGLYRAVWNEQTGQWEKQSESPMISLDFMTVSGDTKLFTFHPENDFAKLVVTGNIIVEINVTIKQYRLETTILRTDATGDTSPDKNNTAVSLSIYVSPTEYTYITVGGVAQKTKTLTRDGNQEQLDQSIAQHSGCIIYEFVTPEGYRLDTFTMNGLSLTDMAGYATVNSSKYEADESRYYYRISVTVCTALVNGAAGFYKSSADLISVKMTLTPIVYDVYIVINRSLKGFDTFNDRNGASDGQTLIVYSPKTAVHFSKINIEPSLLEGYQIDTTTATIGKTGGLAYAVDAASFIGNAHTKLTSRQSLTFDYRNIPAADVTKDKTAVFFFFNTSIIYYRLNIAAEVYYSENDQLKTAVLNEHPSAGTLECNIANRIKPSEGGTVNLHEIEPEKGGAREVDKDYPYFSTVTVKAAAGSGFALFAVYEYLYNVNNQVWEWQIVSDNVNELSYVSKTDGSLTTYTLSFTVNGRGARSFRFDFKQRTTVTVNVPNPYKYVLGASNPHMSYAEIMGYESDVPNAIGSFLDVKNAADGVVRTQYLFEVFVGNYFSVNFLDVYRRSAKVNFSVYSSDLRTIAMNSIEMDGCYTNNVFDTTKFKTVYGRLASEASVPSAVYTTDTKTSRYRITGETVFYVYDNDVYGYVSAQKETLDAITDSQRAVTTGGSVFYNESNVEPRNNVIYEDTIAGTTKEGNVLTIVCQANDNYAFYRLRFRQVNKTESKRKGYIVYGNTDLDSWKTLTYTSASGGMTSTLRAFNGSSSDTTAASYLLLNFRQNGNKYIFTVWMNGDIEIVAEYYRTYNVSYAVYLPDVLLSGGTLSSSQITATDISDTVFMRNGVGPFEAAGDGTATISYGAEFKLEVKQQTKNYVFVGWYINDVNLFGSRLNKLMPSSEYYTWKFIADKDNMSALIKESSGGATFEEVTDIVIYARFEPVIDVQLVNEKYYAYPYHFNSWDVGVLQSIYYSYSRAQNEITGVPGSSSTIMTGDENGRSIANALTEIADNDVALQYGTAWSELYSDSVVNAYNGTLKSNYIVHTSRHYFSVLLENITDEDYINNSWVTSQIELYMTGMPTDVAFSSWQYFRWDTQKWVTIPYKYVDPSFGLSADGTEYEVDAYSSEYQFSLSALYSGIMPYAVSSTRADNLQNDYPLLIRPDVYKYFTVDLTQYAFSTSYANGLTDVDYRKLGEDVASPYMQGYKVSNSEHPERNLINDDNVSGTFEYGTTLYLLYNGTASGEEVYKEGKAIRYRFIGWHLELSDPATSVKKTYYLQNSNDADRTGDAFNYQLICASTASDTIITLMTYYVAQYKQVFSSYSIWGSSNAQNNYTASAATKSGKAAPQGYIVANGTATPILIDSVHMENDCIVYNNLSPTTYTETDYYQVAQTVEVDGICTRLSVAGNAYSTQSSPTWSYEYYIDAGLEYELHVKKNTDLYSTEDIKNPANYRASAFNYYNHNFDTLYRLYEDSVMTQDFSSFYNTGNGTYFANNRQVSPTYLTRRSLNAALPDSDRYVQIGSTQPNDWYTAVNKYFTRDGSNYVPVSGAFNKSTQYYMRLDNLLEGWAQNSSMESVKTYSSTTTHNVDLQYVTTATLIFYNMIYESGITLVNASFIRALTGGQKSTLTVWDTSSLYGDWVDTGADEVSPTTSANGEIVIRVTMIGISGNGYAGYVKYTLKGMKEGNGILGRMDVTDKSGSGLFSPTYPGFGRWTECDLNNFYDSTTVIQNTRVFGYGGFLTNAAANSVNRSNNNKVGTHQATPDCYNATACGSGIEARPYKIFVRLLGNTTNYITDNTQLRFVDTFWYYNGFSCKNDAGEPSYFRIDNTASYPSSSTGAGVNVNGIGNGVINLSCTGGGGISYSQAASSDPQGSRAYIWQPLCASTAGDGETIKGFDGIIDFRGEQGVRVFGFAVNGDASYSGQYYGLFAKVCGGTVMNLTVVNGYYANIGQVTYLGLVCGYAVDATFSHIYFQFENNRATYNSGETFTFKGTAGQAHLFLYGPDFVGALFGYGKRCDCETIILNYGSLGGAYVEVSAQTYGGTLIGAIEGGSLRTVEVRSNTWLVSNASIFVQASAGAGGLVGYAGGKFTVKSSIAIISPDNPDDPDMELTVANITMAGSPSIIVGISDSAAVAGGIFGVIGPLSTVGGIKVTTSTNIGNAFLVDEVAHTATTGTVMLRSGLKSKSDSTLKSLSGGNGFAGLVAALNYGTLKGNNVTEGIPMAKSEINSIVYSHSGTAGALVGANFGTIEKFTLGSNFRLFAWEPLPENSTNSYNFGGLVGFNFGGTGASTRFVADGVASTTDKITYSGLINECRLTGASEGTEAVAVGNVSASTAASTRSPWSSSSVYVFKRREKNGATATHDTDFLTGKLFWLNYTVPYSNEDMSDEYAYYTNRGNYYETQNHLRMGGLVGYSSGRIYNSVVSQVRLSTPQWRYSYNKSSSIGMYAWTIQAGLICGYFDPPTKEIKGWDSYMEIEGQFIPSSAAADGITTKLNNSRIQSCVAYKGSININCNVWMDNMWNSSGPNEGGADDWSLAAGIAVGGIVGGTGANATSNYAVNNCKATNIRFYTYTQAYGSGADSSSATSMEYGWKKWTDTTTYWDGPFKKVTYTNYHSICLRPFCIIELKAFNIVSGLYPQMAGSPDAGRAQYSRGASNLHYATAASSVQGTYQKLGSSTDSNWPFKDSDNTSGIGGSWVRYVKYQGEKKGKLNGDVSSSTVDEYSSIPITLEMNSGAYDDNTSASGYAYGMYNGQVIKTDPNTGCIVCVYDGNGTGQGSHYAYCTNYDGTADWVVSQDAPSSAPSSDYLIG